jgi:diadenosine tetraphosphate (Ap4A) HIT family hydrolase
MVVDSCVFCEILAGESPASMVYEDQRIAASIHQALEG